MAHTGVIGQSKRDVRLCCTAMAAPRRTELNHHRPFQPIHFLARPFARGITIVHREYRLKTTSAEYNGRHRSTNVQHSERLCRRQTHYGRKMDVIQARSELPTSEHGRSA